MVPRCPPLRCVLTQKDENSASRKGEFLNVVDEEPLRGVSSAVSETPDLDCFGHEHPSFTPTSTNPVIQRLQKLIYKRCETGNFSYKYNKNNIAVLSLSPEVLRACPHYLKSKNQKKIFLCSRTSSDCMKSCIPKRPIFITCEMFRIFQNNHE